MRRLSAIVLMLFVFASAAYAAKDQAMSAQQIMDQVISTYASCASYLDEGEVRTLFLTPRGKRTDVKPFSTAFVRPTDFRFEFRDRTGDGEDDWTRYIVWRSPKAVKTWWTIDPGVETVENLSMAIAGATGVSGGSAFVIPSLLLPEMSGMRYASLSNLKLIGEERVGGSGAYKIEGQDRDGTTVTLWIDKESLLIVQLFERTKFPDFETETTTIYKPRVNVEIAAEKLAFNAPEI